MIVINISNYCYIWCKIASRLQTECFQASPSHAHPKAKQSKPSKSKQIKQAKVTPLRVPKHTTVWDASWSHEATLRVPKCPRACWTPSRIPELESMVPSVRNVANTKAAHNSRVGMSTGATW